ncbi:EpsG family protein [Marinobacterium jannaschii]|uniref:EpsG family protein n=1 Tax=Marinobacterium jannaschii TaxID=64970 RepID=UPI001B805AAC|nr:EpsG family protein [Marinobacterium jannaschii]
MLFLVPVLGVISPWRLDYSARLFAFVLVSIFFTIMIGFRHEVGGDWFAYLDHFSAISSQGFWDVISRGDPGYYLINWIVAFFGGSVYIVNLCCAALLMYGLIRFANKQPEPWLSILVAVPYFLIVVAMGYTRQSVAIGFILVALCCLSEKNIFGYLCWVALGALFHKSAIFFLPIAALSSSQNKLATWFWVSVTTATGLALFVLDSISVVWTNYVDSQYNSEGGMIRVIMNSVPAILLLFFYKNLKIDTGLQQLWIWMALISLSFVPLVSLAPAAVDRLALYFIPIQMFVFARLHLLSRNVIFRTSIVLAVILYYALVQWVWLNLSNNAGSWTPYSIYFFRE